MENDSEPMTVQDTQNAWGAGPTDRWVMIRAESGGAVLWHDDGLNNSPEGLPPIPVALAARIEAFVQRYDDLDSANDRFPEPSFWEQRADFPVAAFNEEGRAIAHALKAALPSDWTVVHEDVDAWLRPKGLALTERQLILAPDRPPESQI